MQSIAQVPWHGKRIAVIGDIILDEYVEGYVDRISPEAPVPVLNKTKHKLRLGGAANVALNIKRLGGEPIMIGVAAFDNAGAHIRNIFDTYAIAYRLHDAGRPTTVKTRYVTESGHQLLRVDDEVTESVSVEVEQEISRMVFCEKYDALVIADYSKGCVTPTVANFALNQTKVKKVPSIVDPGAGKNYGMYEYCSLIKPNRKQASEALGINPRGPRGETIARMLYESFNLNNVLVTLGADGMAVLREDDSSSGISDVKLIKQDVQEVFDVSGAGDTVTAVMALGLAAKMDLVETAEWASLAAGIAIQRLGTYAPSLEELLERKAS